MRSKVVSVGVAVVDGLVLSSDSCSVAGVVLWCVGFCHCLDLVVFCGCFRFIKKVT